MLHFGNVIEFAVLLYNRACMPIGLVVYVHDDTSPMATPLPSFMRLLH